MYNAHFNAKYLNLSFIFVSLRWRVFLRVNRRNISL
jgi:hypothetical protein